MPHVRLCILGCPPYTGTVHDFPSEREQERRDLWLKQFSKYPWVGKPKRLFACHRHFSSRMRLGRKLHKTSYPDQNLRPYDPNKPYEFRSALPVKNYYMELELRRALPIQSARLQYDMAVSQPVDDAIEGEDVIVVEKKANHLLPIPKCLLKCEDVRVLYKVPTKSDNFERRKQWFFLLGLDHNIYRSNNIYICDRHFDEDMLDPSRDPLTVYPNKNLPLPLQDSIQEDMEAQTTCIQNCTDYKRKYSFPSVETDYERRRMWLLKFGRDPDFYNHDVYACDRHFSDEMRSDRYLISSALPDQNVRSYRGILEQGSIEKYREITERERANLKEQVERTIQLQRERWKHSQSVDKPAKLFIPTAEPKISVIKDSNILDGLNATVIKTDEPSPLSYVKMNTLGIFVPISNGYIESLSKVLAAEDPLDLEKQIPLEWTEPIEPKLDLQVYHIEKGDYEDDEEESECHEDGDKKYDYNEYGLSGDEHLPDETIPTRSLTPIEEYLGDFENNQSWNYFAQQKPISDICNQGKDDYENNENISYCAKTSAADIDFSALEGENSLNFGQANKAIDANKGFIAKKTTENGFTTSYLNHLAQPRPYKRIYTPFGKRIYKRKKCSSYYRVGFRLENNGQSDARKNAADDGNILEEKQKIGIEEKDSLETLLKKCYALTDRKATTELTNSTTTEAKLNSNHNIMHFNYGNAIAKRAYKIVPGVKHVTSDVSSEKLQSAQDPVLQELAASYSPESQAVAEIPAPVLKDTNIKIVECRTLAQPAALFAANKVPCNITNLLNVKPLDERTNSVAYSTSWQQVVDLVQNIQKNKGTDEGGSDDMLIDAVLNGTSWQQVREILAKQHRNSDISKAVSKILNEAEANAPKLADVSSAELEKPGGSTIHENKVENKPVEASILLGNQEANKARDIMPQKHETNKLEENKPTLAENTTTRTKAIVNAIKDPKQPVVLVKLGGKYHLMNRNIALEKQNTEARELIKTTQSTTAFNITTVSNTSIPSFKPASEKESSKVAQKDGATIKAAAITNKIADKNTSLLSAKPIYVTEKWRVLTPTKAKPGKIPIIVKAEVSPVNTNVGGSNIKPGTFAKDPLALATTYGVESVQKAASTSVAATEKGSSKSMLVKPVNNSMESKQQCENLHSDDSLQKKSNKLLNDDLNEQQVDEILLNDDLTKQLFESLLDDGNRLNDGMEVETEIKLKDDLNELQAESILSNDITEQQIERLQDKSSEEQAESLLSYNLKHKQPESFPSEQPNYQQAKIVLNNDVPKDLPEKANTENSISHESTDNILSQDPTQPSHDDIACVMQCENFKKLFAFPTRTEAMLRRHFWFLQIGLDLNHYWHKTLYICNNHFDENMFVNEDTLNQYAYPSEKLKHSTHTSIATQAPICNMDLMGEIQHCKTLEERADNEITRLQLLIRLKQEAARILDEINSVDNIS